MLLDTVMKTQVRPSAADSSGDQSGENGVVKEG